MNRNQLIDPFETPLPDPTSTQGLIDPFDESARPKSKLDPYIDSAVQKIASIPGAQKTLSTIAPALDVLSRPSYAVNKFIYEYQKPQGELLGSIASAFSELVATGNNRAKLSYSDVIRAKDPDFAFKNPTAIQVIGFIGDVALDPTTYFGIGAIGRTLKVAGGTLNKAGINVVKEALPNISRKAFVAEDGTLKLIESLPKVEKEAQKVIQRAERFEKRIKDSDVVDNSGELIPLYHGTDAPDFKSFKTSGDVDGVYFTTLPDVASIYAGQNGRVIKAYSSAKNILNANAVVPKNVLDAATKMGVTGIIDTDTTVDVLNAMRNKIDPSDPLKGQKGLITELKKLGYSGMRFMSDDGGVPHQQYLIFSNRNIIQAYVDKGVIAANKVENRTGEIGKLDDTKAILTERGYFDAVADKASEINKLFNNILQGNTNASTDAIANAIAKTEVIDDLNRVARNAAEDTLTENEVLERVTSRMSKLVETNPNLVNTLLEKKGLYLKAGLPFSQQIPLFRIFGTEYLGKQINLLSKYVSESNKFIPKLAFTVGRTFSRDFGLPPEYIKFRNELENEFGYLSDEMIRQTRKLFKDINSDGRERIGSAMHWADDETRKLEEIRKASADPNFRTLTDGEAAQIFQQGAEKFKLTPEEFAVMSSMQQAYKEAALLEMRAGLLKHNLLNYSARGYEVIENADDMSLITRGKYGSAIPQPFLASAQQRKFLTKAEAEAAGLVPELDAAILYAHRVLSSQRALAIKSFKDSVTELFGTYDPRLKTAHTGILPSAILEERLPARVISDMKMIGNSVIPSGINDTQREWLRLVDNMQALWKRGATTIRPTFAPKQLISNTFQSAMILGTKAFKAFDPRVALDTAIILMRGGRPLDELPPLLNNVVGKLFTGNNGADAILAGRMVLQRHFDDVISDDFLNKFVKTTTLGQKFSGAELVQLMREKGVIRGFDSTGESFSKKVSESILREANSYGRVVGTLAKVWNHASFVEDYSRAMLFLNGITMGYSADEAVKLVNKALFDYQRGLSAIEKSVIRRILPFYSFQRFAIPFVLKQTLNRPGDVATVDKLLRTTEKLLITGEELTPAEVDIFNQQGENYLLEQPRILTGFDKTGTASLNILNNLTPWDVLNLFTFDREGKLDIPRTMEKTFLSALTPYLKIPLSAATQRDFFTGRTIDEASRISGNLDYSIGKVIPNAFKDLIRWEVRTNHITGKTTTYINPFVSYYSMQLFPALREYIKPLTDLEKTDGFLWSSVHAARKLIDPTSQQDYDFKYQEQNQLFTLQRDFDEIEKGLVKAKLKGDAVGKDTSFEFEDNLIRLQTFMKVIDERNKARQDFSVRGPGMGNIGAAIDANQVPTDIPQISEPSFK